MEPESQRRWRRTGGASTSRALISSIAGTVILLICGTVLGSWREAPPWFITLSQGLCLAAAAASAGFAYLAAGTAQARALILGQRLAQADADLAAANTQTASQRSQVGRLEADFAAAKTQSGGVAEKLKHIIREINAADTAQAEHCVLVNGKIEQGSKEAASAADVLATLDENARGLASTSQQMSTNISVVATAAEEISSNINTCASTTEEISSNMANVATTIEQMSSNLATIDSALRGLSTAISDVAEKAREGAAVASNAAKASDATTETMSLLGKSAEEIGKVTNVIQIIAQQTNLLALNAAIEAASAGEAGKGFAVVANEVKELAKQTTAATEDIAVKIQGIQANTARAGQAIREITGIINKINDLQGLIAQNVEQQKNATRAISSNVSEAVGGINQVSKNVNEAADGAGSLNGKIAESAVIVAEASRYTRHASGASRGTKEAMMQMMIAVDRVCDAVRELEAISEAIA